MKSVHYACKDEDPTGAVPRKKNGMRKFTLVFRATKLSFKEGGSCPKISVLRLLVFMS